MVASPGRTRREGRAEPANASLVRSCGVPLSRAQGQAARASADFAAAMQRALSRPPKPKAAEQESSPAKDHFGDTRLDATAVFNADATLSPQDMMLTPNETTDSGVYNAPTLADEGQLELEAPVHSGSPMAPSISAPVGPKTVVAPKTSRFTTVDEEAARIRSEQRSSVWLLVGQLAGTLGMLLALIALGWWLTRPASADDLYAAIETHIADNGDEDLSVIEGQITQFMERFPDDERTSNLQPYADELELRKMERKLKFRSRVTGRSESHPIAQLFGEANSLRETNPERAAAILQDLLTLYPIDGKGATSLSEEMRQYMTLADRELIKLRKVIDDRAKEQLPMLRDRLMAAERLEATAPAEAAAMYRALIDLYGDQPWAVELVGEAREHLKSVEIK